MIDQKLVDNIRAYGSSKDDGQGRYRLLVEDLGFRIGEKAKYALHTGCSYPEKRTHFFRVMKELLDHLQIDYTLLTKDYCCSWHLVWPAATAKNEKNIAQAKELSREFILKNFRQAEALGAKSIALFCAGCEPHYANCTKDTSLEIISPSQLLDRHFSGGRLELEADYFPGCYRFRRRLTTEPVNVEPAVRLLNKIEGLRLNHLDSKLCCNIPPLLEQLIGSLTTRTLITPCNVCHTNLKDKLADKGDYQVKMVAEVVLEAVRSQ